jgi:hypothetical protein
MAEAQDPRKLERLVKFCSDQAAVVRREMTVRWPDVVERQRIPKARAIQERLAGVGELLERYKYGLEQAAGQPPALARQTLSQLDPAHLVQAQKALNAAAAEMRGQGPPRASARLQEPVNTDKLAAGPLTGELASRIQHFFAPALSKLEATQPAAPSQPPSRRRRHLDTFLKFGRQVLGHAGPKLQAVDSALKTTKNSPPGTGIITLFQQGGRDAEANDVPLPLRIWIPRLIKLNVDHPTARRVEQHALGQWAAATQQQEAAEGFRLAFAQRGEAALSAYDPARASASLMPLVHLPTTFREVPVLNEMFPMSNPPSPLWEAMRKDMEALAKEPTPAAPPLPAVPAGPAQPEAFDRTKIEAEQASTRRLSTIVAYLNNPKGDPSYEDPAVMYRVVAEEHQYQVDKLSDLAERASLQPEAGEASQAEREAVEKRIRQLANLRKKLAAIPRPGQAERK